MLLVFHCCGYMHNLGNSQVSVYRTIGPTLFMFLLKAFPLPLDAQEKGCVILLWHSLGLSYSYIFWYRGNSGDR